MFGSRKKEKSPNPKEGKSNSKFDELFELEEDDLSAIAGGRAIEISDPGENFNPGTTG